MYVWVLSYNPLTKLHSTRQKRNFCAKSWGPVGVIRPMNSTVLYDIPVLVVGIITCIEGIANSYHVGMGGFPTSIDPAMTYQLGCHSKRAVSTEDPRSLSSADAAT